MKPELIQASTPLVLGGIGLTLGLAAMLSPGITEASRSSGINLALTAIAGAVGVAKAENGSSASIQGESVSIESVQGEEGRN